MEPITIITSIGTGLLAILVPIFGKKYNDIKKKVNFMFKIFDKIDEIVEDNTIDEEEAKSLIKYYNQFIKNIK